MSQPPIWNETIMNLVSVLPSIRSILGTFQSLAGWLHIHTAMQYYFDYDTAIGYFGIARWLQLQQPAFSASPVPTRHHMFAHTQERDEKSINLKFNKLQFNNIEFCIISIQRVRYLDALKCIGRDIFCFQTLSLLLCIPRMDWHLNTSFLWGLMIQISDI